jgi:hypothetical protein
MLYRKHLVMFGPREVLLTSEEPAVKQFLNGRRIGPIGMSEEKDQATAAAEAAAMAAGQSDGGVEEIEGVPPQISVTPGMPVRQGVLRRQARVREILHTLPPAAQLRHRPRNRIEDGIEPDLGILLGPKGTRRIGLIGDGILRDDLARSIADQRLRALRPDIDTDDVIRRRHNYTTFTCIF